jgi:thioredoxin reductase (NADPH)
MKRITMTDLIIIGGGPSGLNVAISAKKAGLKAIVLEKGVLVNSIYDFPVNMTFFSTSRLLEIGQVPFISHGDKPTRMEALEYYRRLKEVWGLEVRLYEAVLSMVPADGGYRVTTSKGIYHAPAVVVATGFYDTPNLLEVPGEDLPKVRHYYSDPHPYIDQDVLVVGARNSACDAALELYSKGARVTMAIRSGDIHENVKYWIRPNIVNRIKEGSIPAYFNTRVTGIFPDEVELEGPEGTLRLKNDFVLAMTGYQPNYALLERLGLPCPSGGDRIPEHDPATLETSLPNVFLSGVVCGGMLTNRYFIENTRDHGDRIAEILGKRKQT